jgi:MmyB-like transcription regulator ligand binding domain
VSVFLDPVEQALYPDWDVVTARLLADLRKSAGNDVADQWFVHIQCELSCSSDRFRQLWSRHDVQSLAGMPTRIRHPRVGDLTLNRDTLRIGGTAQYDCCPSTPLLGAERGSRGHSSGHLRGPQGQQVPGHQQRGDAG